MKPLYTEYCTVSGEGEMQLHVPAEFNYAYDVVDRIAQEDPDRRALVWVQDESCEMYPYTDRHERTFCFSELSELSGQAASCMAAAGIGRGDRVILMMKRHYAYWYTLLGLHKLGAVAMPAVHMLNHEDLVYRIRVPGASAVGCLGEKALCAKVSAAVADCETVKKLFTVGPPSCGSAGG